MFDNNLTVDRDGTDVVFSRKPSTNPFVGTFASPDGLETIEVRQKSTRARKRHEFVLTLRKIAADPLTAVNSEISCSVGVYVDEPKVGFAYEDLLQMFLSVSNFVYASGGYPKLVAGDV